MAEKGFGVKEINLIGASGTPTIESPNNLNLNAVNVAISTNVSIGGTLSVTGNVSVGGTLTYEDVTNIDSVGLITARNGLIVSGVSTLSGNCSFAGNNVTMTASGSPNSLNVSGTSRFEIASIENALLDGSIAHTGDTTTKIQFETSVIKLDTAGTTRINVNNSGATVTGTLSATTFSGSGASLTNLPVADSDIQVAYTVTANGSSAYRFAGNGVVSTADDPDLYLIRGQKYRFINNSGGSHPFQIREASGGTAYSTGVTNNGAASGNIDFAPTFDSPAQLVYQCTSHSGMVGNIYLKDGNGNETNVGVTTFSGLVHLNQLKKTSGTLDYLAATHTFNNAAGTAEYLRITSGGYVNIGGSSTQTTHLLHLQSTGDAGIHIRADSDNSGENDNPYLSMSQDGSTAQELKIGQNGEAGQNFALSLANSPFIHANHSAAYPLQLAHMDTMCVFISSRHNELGLNNYSGNTTAGMEIQNRGNDTATALKLTGHNNTGTPGAETFTQLTHIGSNLTFEIMHAGDRAFHIGSTRRIRVPGVWGVNGSSMRTVQIESDGNLCAPSSIREAKINIESISDVSWLYDFNPVTFNFRTKTEVNGENVWGNESDDGGLQYGLIADEVEAVNQDLCFYDDGKLSGVHYDRMMSPLIKAVQDQKKEIDALKAKVAALKAK